MPATPDAGQRVIVAARELFTERGYAATTTRAIAERAGVNEVTLFRRFSTKVGILRAIAAEFAEQAAGIAVSAGPESSGTGGSGPEQVRARLRELARMEVGSALANGGLALRLALEARSVPEIAEVIGAGASGNFDGLVRYLVGCQQDGVLRADLPADLLAEAFFSLTSTLVMARLLMGSPPPRDPAAVDELVNHLMELFWSGVRTAVPPVRTVDPPSAGTGRPSRS